MVSPAGSPGEVKQFEIVPPLAFNVVGVTDIGEFLVPLVPVAPE
jgi:hypothetical protein